jgi:hypothetical protein
VWDVSSGIELVHYPGFCVGDEAVSVTHVATELPDQSVALSDATWVLKTCDDAFVEQVLRTRLPGMLRLTPDEGVILYPILGAVDPDCLEALNLSPR